MRLRRAGFWAALWSLSVLAGCVGGLFQAQPERGYTIIERIVAEPFTAAGRWDTYDNEMLRIQVVDGSLELFSRLRNYVWSLDGRVQRDVVIQVTASYLSPFAQGIYGVMCRAGAQNDGSGYYFLVSADGAFSIRRGAGSAVDSLVPWQNTPLLRQGQTSDDLRAVCIGDYLAFYINGEFVADVRDSFYQSGYTGLAGALIPRTAEDDVLLLRFSDLNIFSAR